MFRFISLPVVQAFEKNLNGLQLTGNLSTLSSNLFQPGTKLSLVFLEVFRCHGLVVCQAGYQGKDFLLLFLQARCCLHLAPGHGRPGRINFLTTWSKSATKAKPALRETEGARTRKKPS